MQGRGPFVNYDGLPRVRFPLREQCILSAIVRAVNSSQ